MLHGKQKNSTHTQDLSMEMHSYDRGRASTYPCRSLSGSLYHAVDVVITHKYRGSQQFSRVEYSTQIYRFDTRGAKEYLKVLAAELSIKPHLEINYLQQSDQ